jgi:nucleoside-diphosphate-sugar epimerase
MKILVTGNLGYVGNHIVSILNELKIETHGCDLNLYPNAKVTKIPEPQFQIYDDFRNLTIDNLEEFDSVIHMAAISNDPMGKLLAGKTMEINGQGTIDLAKKSKRAGVRNFIFASSCSVYGAGGEKARTEKDSVNPLSEYAESKLFAEKSLSEMASSDFGVYLLRNATAYGSSAVFRSDLVVNDLAINMQILNSAEIKSDGSPWRPLINAYDMARVAIEFAIKDPIGFSGKPINIGFDIDNYQVKQIGKLIEMQWGTGTCKIGTNSNPDPRDYKVDFSLFKSIFPSFNAKFNLETGIADLFNFFINSDISAGDLESNRFVRIEELKKSMHLL